MGNLKQKMETSPEKSEKHRTRQILEAVQPIIERARRITDKVRGMAWVYLAGAVLLTGTIFLPFSSTSLLVYGFAVLVLLLLSVPSIILFLFHAVLESVIALPGRLLEKAGIGEASARTMLETVRSRDAGTVDQKKGKVLRTLVEVRKLVLDSKGMLLEYSALLRLANPFILGIVAGATVIGFGIAVMAVIALIIVLL